MEEDDLEDLWRVN